MSVGGSLLGESPMGTRRAYRAVLASGRLAALFLGCGRGLLVHERLVPAARAACGSLLALLGLLDARLQRGHEVDDRGLGLRLSRSDDLALLDLGLDELEDGLLVLFLVFVGLELRRPHADEVLGLLQLCRADGGSVDVEILGRADLVGPVERVEDERVVVPTDRDEALAITEVDIRARDASGRLERLLQQRVRL